MTKMTLTKEDVRHVADLIKIHIPQEELEKYGDQLNTVLDYLEVFEELDTKDVKITSQVTNMTNVLEEDKARESLPQDEALKNANKSKDGYFVVKKVL